MSTGRLAVVQLLPELQSGGVERGTLEIARALAVAGHRSVVVSAGGRMVSRLLKEGSEHICMAVGRKHLQTLLLIRRLRTVLREMQPDILHLRSRLPAWIGYLAWRGLPPADRPHLVSTVHGLYSVNRYSAVMTRGEAVIAVSQTVRDYIQTNYPQVPAERIVLIPRGVDEEEFPPDTSAKASWASELRGQVQCPPERRLVLFPGRITRWKGLQTAVEVLRQMAAEVDVQLLVAGEVRRDKERFLGQMQRAAEAAGVAERLSFLGHCSDMRRLYVACDLVLHLAHKPEAFGRVAAEALAVGTPLVGWDRGGVGEVLRKAFPQGAVSPDNISLLVERATQVLRSEKAAQQVRTHCFPLQQMQAKTLDLYDNLARGDGAVQTRLNQVQ